MAKKTGILFISFMLINAVLLYFAVHNPITFTQRAQNPAAAVAKYGNIWEDETVIRAPYREPKAYQLGDRIGSITIPRLEIYEMPIYYGTTDENKNWQITTPGYAGNWQMFGEYGLAAVGAHNYQLFHKLDDLVAGDRVIVETLDDIYVYQVVSADIFNHEEEDWGAFAYAGKEPYAIDIITCYPFDSDRADDRYLVYATLQKGTVFADKQGKYYLPEEKAPPADGKAAAAE